MLRLQQQAGGSNDPTNDVAQGTKHLLMASDFSLSRIWRRLDAICRQNRMTSVNEANTDLASLLKLMMRAVMRLISLIHDLASCCSRAATASPRPSSLGFISKADFPCCMSPISQKRRESQNKTMVLRLKGQFPPGTTAGCIAPFQWH